MKSKHYFMYFAVCFATLSTLFYISAVLTTPDTTFLRVVRHNSMFFSIVSAAFAVSMSCDWNGKV